MTQPSSFEKILGQPLDQVVQLQQEQRAQVLRAAIPDLNFFFDQGRGIDRRDAPERTRALAGSLFAALATDSDTEGARVSEASSLAERIVTDGFLRSEADRDQNVYLGSFFTRRLTHAVPDLIFQPTTAAEAARALRWSRDRGVPVTLRGAASTAMGGAVPCDGGLTLDLSRLDSIEIDSADRVCVIGAGARLRAVHQKLAERGLALRAYPSNLGGTWAGWFATGGVGMNAFGRGRALDSVRAADLLLPSGEQLRFHDDGRLDVPDQGGRRGTLSPAESATWFHARGMKPLVLADLAGSEGAFGIVLQLMVTVEPRPEIGAFLLSFASEKQALAAASWVRGLAGEGSFTPANLKFLSGSHLHHTRRVWQDEDSRGWRRRPGDLSSGADLPWRRIVGPRELGAACGEDTAHAAAHLFVDFFDLEAARRFARALGEAPGTPIVLDRESIRFAAERFKPQQTKRLGPGLIAAEILMPADQAEGFLPAAHRLTSNVGNSLDAEIYYLADGEALVIGGTLTDHRGAGFLVDLMIAPALLDLAITRHRGRPYVLGRWQAAFLDGRFGSADASRRRSIKTSLDRGALLNRGVAFGMGLHGPLGAVVAGGFRPMVSLTRAVYATPALAWLARGARAMLGAFPGPAHGRGSPAEIGAAYRATPAEPATNGASAHASSGASRPEERALHCVNCGECNSVCPIFQESKIRLPQMLTHLGEAVRAGETIPATGSVLLDLCMRCGNCEEVCQAGIPHLPLYEVMQRASDHARPRDPERHTAIVASVRGSARYTRDFLRVRPGGYIKRSPVALPGVVRYVLMRAENDAGPAASCIHCGACVSVCPTHANREFEGADPRWITTEQNRCIGCGTCVEICPANLANGGQTLRVMEAPTPDWFLALETLERGAKR